MLLALVLLAAPAPAAGTDVTTALSSLYAYNRNAPLDVTTLATEDLEPFTREKFVFTGRRGVRVPAYLALPKTEAPKAGRPLVVLIDGLTGSKERWFQPDSWPRGLELTRALINQGYAVLALDAPFHGERAAEGGFTIPEDWLERRDFIMQSIVEHRRALDALSSRAGLDTQRVAVVGLSIGSLMATVLSVVDERVKSVVLGLVPLTRVRAPDFAAIAPRSYARAMTKPTFVFIGKRDLISPADEAQQLFNSIAAKQKHFVAWDTDHRPPLEYVEAVSAWLVKTFPPAS